MRQKDLWRAWSKVERKLKALQLGMNALESIGEQRLEDEVREMKTLLETETWLAVREALVEEKELSS